MAAIREHSCLLSLVDSPDYDDPFNPRHAEQVSRALNDLLTDMCVVSGVQTYKELTPSNLNKRGVTKERLCQWACAFAYMMDQFANPHLQMAVERLDKINSELLSEKKNVINLQAQLIEKRDEELVLLKSAVAEEVKSVQSVVETELKSYSSALTKTCTAALAPQKLRAAVKSVSEKEDRGKNVMIYGLEESLGEQLQDKVSQVLSEIEEKPLIRDCCGVGLKKDNNKRPIKFSLSSSDMVNQILRKAKILRTKEGYRHIYISPDRTIDERRAFKKLWEQLQLKRKSETDKVHFIKNNKIVSLNKTLSAPDLKGTI